MVDIFGGDPNVETHVLDVQAWCWLILKWYSGDIRDTVILLDTSGYFPSHFA